MIEVTLYVVYVEYISVMMVVEFHSVIDKIQVFMSLNIPKGMINCRLINSGPSKIRHLQISESFFEGKY